MQLEGLHHVTMVTGDAQRTIDFYSGVLGLRLVKTTVNFDQPEAYHLYFGDERGRPGSILTWFEFRGARKGRAGAGMVHRVQLAVPSVQALERWGRRLQGLGVPVSGGSSGLLVVDPDGLELELLVHDIGERLVAEHPDIPAEDAICGVLGIRAFSGNPDATALVLTDLLGFGREPGDGEIREWTAFGPKQHVHLTLDPAPSAPGIPGAGTVHHVAWASRDEDHDAWRTRMQDAGASITPVIDRDYFHAIYFREPGGILFEIATNGPGFATDEDVAHLGERLRLPAQHEARREELAGALTPLVHPRTGEPVSFEAP